MNVSLKRLCVTGGLRRLAYRLDVEMAVKSSSGSVPRPNCGIEYSGQQCTDELSEKYSRRECTSTSNAENAKHKVGGACQTTIQRVMLRPC